MKRKPSINPKLVEKLISRRIGDLDPAGGVSTFVDHPNRNLRKRNCIELAFVIEHRFAFSYWIKWKQAAMQKQQVPDPSFRPPDLVTWDWHDDVGGECDFIVSELELLDQSNESEVGFFCWAGLRSINDGHIAPAVWLNAIGDVYVLQKQRDKSECLNQSFPQQNRFGASRNVRLFNNVKDLTKALAARESGKRTIWDLDLDFFVGPEGGGIEHAPVVSKRTIRSLLNYNKPWMPAMLCDLVGITIAIEPMYTGGMSRSLSLYQTWEESLFTGSVFDDDCAWKAELPST